MTTREPISIENGRVEIHTPENRVWLTRHQIADLFGCKLSCKPELWNARESRLDGKSRGGGNQCENRQATACGQ